MNKQDIDTITQVFILAMQGTKEYDLMYQHHFNPLLSHIGLSTSHYCKYLIRMYEVSNKPSQEVKNET